MGRPCNHPFLICGMCVFQVYGPESSGKTTLAMQAIAEVQKRGGTAVLVDAEHAFDPVYSGKVGVDIEKLMIVQAEAAEEALEVVDRFVRSSAVDIICIDSVAALVPKAEIEGEMGHMQGELPHRTNQANGACRIQMKGPAD